MDAPGDGNVALGSAATTVRGRPVLQGGGHAPPMTRAAPVSGAHVSDVSRRRRRPRRRHGSIPRHRSSMPIWRATSAPAVVSVPRQR